MRGFQFTIIGNNPFNPRPCPQVSRPAMTKPPSWVDY